MLDRGSDTSPGEVSVLHIPLPDGSCRLIPAAALDEEEGLLLWTRAHARFELTATDPPVLAHRDGSGLLANAEWAARISGLIQPKLDALSGPGKRQALNAFARLAYDCPPVVFLEPVARALSSVLAEREVAFIDAFRSLATKYQHGAGSREKDTGRIRPSFIAAWETVEKWRLAHGRHGLAADCAAIAASTHHGKRQALLEREAARLARAYLRAKKHPSIKVAVLVQVGCPQHNRSLHVVPSSDRMPVIDRPQDAAQARALYVTINVGRVEARPPRPRGP